VTSFVLLAVNCVFSYREMRLSESVAGCSWLRWRCGCYLQAFSRGLQLAALALWLLFTGILASISPIIVPFKIAAAAVHTLTHWHNHSGV
jgi:hypothetical protein